MNRQRRIARIATAVIIASIAVFFVIRSETVVGPSVPEEWEQSPQETVISEVPVASASEEVVSKTEEEPLRSVSALPVPFTPQAPFAEWSDAVFQDACEEASLVMAWHWIAGTSLSPLDAKNDIISLTAFERKRFGRFVGDLSAEDTLAVFHEYYQTQRGEFRTDASMERIVRTLMAGHIVLVPTDGRKLGNPNFVSPGPVTHMLVIIGYDALRNEYIVNDPGTRRGFQYRYPVATVYDAITEYPTGNHETVSSTRKVMILL